MYVILTIFIFGFSMVQSERLECYDCSEIATDSAAVCSKNETRSKKALDDEGNSLDDCLTGSKDRIIREIETTFFKKLKMIYL